MNTTKLAGVAGIAAAATVVGLSAGAGTAEAKPGKNPPPTPNTTSGSPTANAATPSGPRPFASILNSIGTIFHTPVYNPGPLKIGVPTSPPPGFIVKPPDPANGKPFMQITGFQLPFWTVDPTTGKPKVPF